MSDSIEFLLKIRNLILQSYVPHTLKYFPAKTTPCRRRRPQPAVGVADERADQSHRAAAPCKHYYNNHKKK